MILFGDKDNIRGRLSYLEDVGWKHVERFHNTWNDIDKARKRITELEERISLLEVSVFRLLSYSATGSLTPENSNMMLAVMEMCRKDKELPGASGARMEYREVQRIIESAQGK